MRLSAFSWRVPGILFEGGIRSGLRFETGLHADRKYRLTSSALQQVFGRRQPLLFNVVLKTASQSRIDELGQLITTDVRSAGET